MRTTTLADPHELPGQVPEPVRRLVERLDDHLERYLCAVPYNSAAQILEYFDGSVLPNRMGCSCAFQSFLLARELRKTLERAPQLFKHGRHVAVVLEVANHLVVLDPYLLHRKPLVVSKSTPTAAVAVSDAFPIRRRSDGRAAPSRVRATWSTELSTLRLDYVRYSERRQHNALFRSFSFPSDAAMASFPSHPDQVRAQLLHREQNNLSVRALHPVSLEMVELILPLRDVSVSRPAQAAQMATRANSGVVSLPGQPGFDRDVATLCEAIRISRAEVVEHLLHAAAVYARHAPVDRDLDHYSLEDA